MIHEEPKSDTRHETGEGRDEEKIVDFVEHCHFVEA
jgi:hypothetical protein